MSAFKGIKRGALHRELHVPEGEDIPGGRRKMNQICHGSIGEHVMVGDHEVTVSPIMKKRACWANNFGKY